MMRSVLILLLAVLTAASGQPRLPKGYQLSSPGTDAAPLSNSIIDIVVAGDTLWLGTGKGLSRSIDGGATWKNYYNTPEFGTEDISAIAVRGRNIWVATAHTVERDGSSLPEGSGLRHSSDGGETWHSMPQPVDIRNVDTLYYNDKSLIRALGITTAINNVTYDIALTKDAVWITSFAGMVRKSTDSGATWERVIIPPDNLNSISPSDSLVFDLSPSGGALQLQNNLNHRAFSVLAENDSTIWIGTAGGINKSTDGGRSWVRFTKQNQAKPVSGNFVVALAKHPTTAGTIIWAATVNATDNTEVRGVSMTRDGGASWERTLLGQFAHNFGFNGGTVYVPTDDGIFRSTDHGETWLKAGLIYDAATHRRYTQSKFYSAAALNGTAWFGGIDGVVSTHDNGNDFGAVWSVLHPAQPVSSPSATYAYPNPFAPDDEQVRIHYSIGGIPSAVVTVRIFDFAMHLVRTVVHNAIRSGGPEFDELWDGRDDRGNVVANGVYFHQVTVNDSEPRWGKILVIQ